MAVLKPQWLAATDARAARAIVDVTHFKQLCHGELWSADSRTRMAAEAECQVGSDEMLCSPSAAVTAAAAIVAAAWAAA